ncbi:DUF7344 domain-containing protein [Saliphagus infecundisoli]|uniref:DUF7344 domain-containing protein n=1 Tax=Saliphagus infecundisoli TaxID=1849069 RepID=A0ABD5Q9G4_9EURY|nr:hypothetical protein [Saliphagus infecundisoli]
MSDDGYSGRLEKRTVGQRSRHDRLFELLSEHRRRVLLRYVEDRPVVTVGELAAIVSEETGTATSEAAISIRHADLPALADAGLIEYDSRSSTVRYDGDDLVSDLLEVATRA